MISVGNDTNQLDFQQFTVETSIGEDNFSNISGASSVSNSDPLFTNPSNSDFTLQSTSPAIDAGDNTKIPTGILTLDLLGNDRIFNTTVDMGAYEFDPNAITQYTLTTLATNGTITTDIAPTNGSYANGTIVELTATPDTGYQFDGWSGDASGTTNPLSITMDENKSVTAIFSPIQHTLTTSATNGTITADLAPINGTYDYGTVVELTATPATGYQFDGWSGDASGTANPLSITIDADKTVTAMFSPIQHTLSITSTNGTVTMSVQSINGTYDYGTIVELTATPNSGYAFAGWSGDASGTTNPLNVTMDTDKNITALFTSTLSVIDNEFKNVLKVYPNPVRDHLQISVASNYEIATIEIFNLLGKKVKEEHTNSIDVTRFETGVYLVKITDTQGRIAMKKIIKE